MGNRGPRPTPATVHQLRGNPSKLTSADLSAGVTPLVEIPGCPRHLLPEARKEWKRIGRELEALGLIARIDRAALALYCQAWAWMVWHETELQAAIETATAAREAHVAAAVEAAQAVARASGPQSVEDLAAVAERATVKALAKWTGGDGFQLQGPNGGLVYNPHWVGKNKAAEQVDKFLASFGMSPSARSRVTASDNRQGELPLPPPAAEGGPPAPAKPTLASFRRV